MLLFFVSFALVLLLGFGVQQATIPDWFGKVMLLESGGVCVCESRFAFVTRDIFRLEVVLDDGAVLRIDRHGKLYMMQLAQALRQALAMQRMHRYAPSMTYS